MKFLNKFDFENELNIQEGSKVEIIVRSSLNCDEDEQPEYHSGTVSEIIFEEFKEGTFPVGMYVKFDKDFFYEDHEEEFVSFSEIEDVFVKKYEILGYGKLNTGVTLSVKGDEISKVVWFTYRNGSLIPEHISDGPILKERPISEEDKEFIREISKYGAFQTFSHYVLSKSK